MNKKEVLESDIFNFFKRVGFKSKNLKGYAIGILEIGLRSKALKSVHQSPFFKFL